MADKDLYAVLGVPRTATADEIKKAYRKLARELHPDRNPGNKKAEDRFKDVSYANDVLSDPKSRGLYDEFGTLGLREGFDAEAARRYKSAASMGGVPGNLQDLLDSLQGSGGQAGVDLDSLFGGSALDQIFGARGRRGARRPVQGADLGAEVSVSLPEALRGAERELALAVPGSREHKKLKTRLPPGVSDGEKVRLRGQGAPGKDGGPPGDLVLTVRVAPHAVLRREGDELHLELPVTVGEAVRGAKVAVPTLDGEISLRIPPRTQSGATLRVRGKGVPRRSGGEPGDLFVHVRVLLPLEASDKDLEAFVKNTDSMYKADLRDKMKL